MSSDHPKSPTAHPVPQEDTPLSPSYSQPQQSAAFIPTAASRLAASAANLGRALLKNSTSPGVAASVLSAVGNPEKGEASSSIPVEAGAWAQGSEASKSKSIAAERGHVAEHVFRESSKFPPNTGWDAAEVRQELAEFEGDGTFARNGTTTRGDLESEFHRVKKEKGKDKEQETSEHTPWHMNGIQNFQDNVLADDHTWTSQFRIESEDLRYMTPTRSPNSHANQLPANDVARAEYADGHEVISLLNQPRSNSIDDMAAIERDFADAELVSADDLFQNPNELAAGDAEAIHKYKTIFPLTAPPIRTSVSKSNSLNLWPSLDTLAEGAEVLLHGNEEQKREWVGAWENVAKNYVDEVWGDGVCPWVLEATVAIREMEGEKIDEAAADRKLGPERTMDDSERKEKALARLRMVLRHMKMDPNHMR